MNYENKTLPFQEAGRFKTTLQVYIFRPQTFFNPFSPILDLS